MAGIIIDASGSEFTISGDIGEIVGNRRAKSNFKSIDASFDNGSKIRFDYNDENKAEVYSDITRLLDKFRIEYTLTPAADQLVAEVRQREKNFAEFSQKAQNIRDNRHEGNDFEEFTDTVSQLIKRKLYTLQLLSAYHLAFAQNACNFSVPGAGKTSVVYAAYAYLRSLPESDQKRVDRLLIICPLSAFGPWKDEYMECFGTPPRVKELAGLDARRRESHFILPGDIELTIISYQSASTDTEFIKNFLEKHNVMVVLDEAHRIKNTAEDAVWANEILSLADHAKARVVLTGTPAPNGYEDLWNLFKFIWPHKDIIKFPLPYLASLDEKPADEKQKLIENIKPFFMRVKKADLKLPPPVYNEPIMVPMAADQRAIYDHIEKNYVASFEAADNVGFSAQLQKAKTIRLRQCLTNPALLKKPLDEFRGAGVAGVNDREILTAIDSYEATPNKFIEIAKLIKEITARDGPQGKVIVWAYFIGNIDDLSEYLDSQGMVSNRLYGATPNENEDTPEDVETREKIIRDFHDDECPYKVIVANPFAVGESISLHKACHNAVYLEKDFNATNYMQSKDRTHRYGLEPEDAVNYYFMLSEDSIDQTIHDRVLEKEARMLEIIESEDIPLLQMNMSDDEADEDDIRAIIRDYHARKSAAAIR